MVALDSNSRIAKGEEAEIWMDATHMHLFDPATGDNLTLGN